MSVRKDRSGRQESGDMSYQAFGSLVLPQICRKAGENFVAITQVCTYLNKLMGKEPGAQWQSWTYLDMVRVTRTGFPKKSLSILARALDVDKVVELDEILSISRRSLQRYEAKRDTERLSKDLSDHIMQVFKVYLRAVDVFEDQDSALRWLKSPIPSLGKQVPLKLLDTSSGVDLVLTELGRIEHGVFA